MRKQSAFSLIELLVALSILAVVAAIIVPKFLNVRQNAQTTSIQANLSQINSTYNSWAGLGGTFADPSVTGFDPNGDTRMTAALVLAVLSSSGTDRSTIVNGYKITDPALAQNIALTGGVKQTGTDLFNIFGITGNTYAAGINTSTPDGIYLASPSAHAYYKSGNSAYEFNWSPQGFTLGSAINLSTNPIDPASGY